MKECSLIEGTYDVLISTYTSLPLGNWTEFEGNQ